MTHYLGITLGPIHATLQEARSTKEIWAASYLFSRLTELLLDALPSIGAQIIVPVKVATSVEKRLGTGIYNDRIFASLPVTNKDKIAGLIEHAITQLADELAPKGKKSNPAFWRNYLRIGWVCKPLASLNNGTLFSEIGTLLDAQELHTPYFNDSADENELVILLDKVYQTTMAEKALDNAKGTLSGLMRGKFPSTDNLGTVELYRRKPMDYKRIQKTESKSQKEADQADEFYSLLLNDEVFKSLATDYHKYFCIVHADVDNLGKRNKQLSDEQAYRELSDQLSQFALAAADAVDKFGGKTVFAGGDDLLFFAPVCSYNSEKQQTESIFRLIQVLDEQFNKLGFSNTSLSFGITLTYYKYPLFEARQISNEQLNDVAKQVKWQKGGKKNAVAVRLLKHSGAWFEAVLSKSILKAFLKAESQIRHTKDDLLSGVIYKMDTLQPLIRIIREATDTDERLESLFTNFFNEPIHKRNQAQLGTVQELVRQILDDGFQVKDRHSASVDKNLYALLRLLQFVTATPKVSANQKSEKNAAITEDI